MQINKNKNNNAN